MKVLLIADSTTKLYFLHYDSDFEKSFCESMLGHHKEQLSFSSLVQMHFAPLVLTVLSLKEKLSRTCSSVTCQDGTLMLFQEHDGLLYVGIQDVDSSDDLAVELSFLHSLVCFLYGPFYQMQLNSQSVSQRKRAWSNISSCMSEFRDLRSSAIPMLFEAIDRVRVNSTVADACGGTLNKCAGKMEKQTGEVIQHAFLFVDSKLFAYHQRDGEILQTANILNVIVLLNSEQNEKKNVEFEEENEEPHSGNGTPDNTDDITSDDVMSSTNIFSSDEDEDRNLTTPEVQNVDATELKRIPEVLVMEENVQPGDLQPEEINARENYSTTECVGSVETESKTCYCTPVFLPMQSCPFVPHKLYVIPVSHRVKIAFLTKVRHPELSEIICAMLHRFNKLQFDDAVGLRVLGGIKTVQMLNKCSKLLFKRSKKLSGKISNRGCRTAESWKLGGQKQLRTFMTTQNTEIVSLLKKSVSQTELSLFRFHKLIFPSVAEVKVLRSEVNLESLQNLARSKLSGYADYLRFKSRHNFTITPFHSQFPGLVHFAFVQRNRSPISFNSQQDCAFQDEIYAPALESSGSSANEQEIYDLLKKLVQSCVKSSIAKLCQGETIFEFEQQDFIFTSQTWVNGKKSLSAPILKNLSKIENRCLSVFPGDAYRTMMGSNEGIPLRIDHVFCVHFAFMPRHVIAGHQSELRAAARDGLRS